MVTKNYCYGAIRATEFADQIDDAIRLAHRYRNRLCELELERRAEVDRIVNELCDDYVWACHSVRAAEEEIETIYSAIRKRGQQERRKVKPTADERDQIKQLKDSLRTLRADRKAAKDAAFARPDVRAALDQNSAAHRDRCKAARAESGLCWGTYLDVENAAKDFAKGPPPRFKRYTGEGKIAVQLQGGLSAEDAVAGNDTRLRILPGDGRRAELLIRIGSNGRAPVFARIPFVMHRPLPDQSIVKWAFLEKRRVASDEYWQLRLTLTMPDSVRDVPDSVVAVHVGWRKLNDGSMRVATWRGSDGESGELNFSPDRVKAKAVPDGLQTVRDRRFNRTKARLAQWIDAAAKRGIAVPDWLQEARKTIRMWRSQDRFVKLLLHWRENRFASDATAFRLLHGLPNVPRKGWRKWDKHLWLWDRHQRKNLSRWRLDTYRKFARSLASRYGRVCLLQADWAKMRQKAEVGEQDGQVPAMRRLSSLAAVGELERCLKEAFGADCLVPIDTKHLSADCHHCGSREEVGAKQKHQCSGCGRAWDVDDNAVRNQLTRAEVAKESLPPLAAVMRQRFESDGRPTANSKRRQEFAAGRKRVADAKQLQET